MLVAALPGSTAHAALSTLPYVHDGTACQSTSGTHNLPSGMSQTGVAFDGSRLLLSCWGDTTITAVDPVSGAELQVYAVSGKGLTGNPIRAFGALAYDRASGTLWACASYSTSAKTERNSVEVGIVTLSSGGTGTYTPEFNSKGCINGLAVDPGTATGRAGTLWTSANIATSMYEYSGLPTPGKQIGSAVNVGGLIGYNS
ncbi:MAG TPA: hypothetical protein VMU66_07515, partial [Gaiellales bacterium]|nr:hypothetical protein [Gaiellales bacterium]